jgi:hypothetical protein
LTIFIGNLFFSYLIIYLYLHFLKQFYMRKMLLAAVVLGASLSLTSCGGGADSAVVADYKKVRELTCEAQKLAASAATDPSVAEKAQKISKEVTDLSQKLAASASKMSQATAEAVAKVSAEACK